MKKILNVRAREILDSRGNPTVEVEVFLEDHLFLPEHLPAFMKHVNCAIWMQTDIWAKASSMLYIMSIRRSLILCADRMLWIRPELIAC